MRSRRRHAARPETRLQDAGCTAATCVQAGVGTLLNAMSPRNNPYPPTPPAPRRSPDDDDLDRGPSEVTTVHRSALLAAQAQPVRRPPAAVHTAVGHQSASREPY